MTDLPATEPVHVTFEGRPTGGPPLAPGVQRSAPPEAIELDRWFCKHVDNGGVHAKDVAHRNRLFHAKEAMKLMVHSKYPVES